MYGHSTAVSFMYDFMYLLCRPQLEQHFLAPLHLKFAFFYETFPVNTTAQVLDMAQKFGMQHVKGEQYRTKLGVTFYLVPIVLNVPKFLLHRWDLLERADWMYCHEQKWSFGYTFYNTVNSVHWMRNKHAALLPLL